MQQEWHISSHNNNTNFNYVVEIGCDVDIILLLCLLLLNSAPVVNFHAARGIWQQSHLYWILCMVFIRYNWEERLPWRSGRTKDTSTRPFEVGLLGSQEEKCCMARRRGNKRKCDSVLQWGRRGRENCPAIEGELDSGLCFQCYLCCL